VFDGVLIIFGAALLLTPGFLTDIVGLILLIPPTRAMVRGLTRRFVVTRFAIGPATWGYGRARGRRARRGAPGEAEGARQGRPASVAEDFSWTTPSRPGPRPGDIEGTGHEVGEDDSLPPGERGTFSG
jgi:UPF0716 protein FxsA